MNLDQLGVDRHGHFTWTSDDGTVTWYRAQAPFTVDGIRYCTAGNHIRTMIDIYDDHDCDDGDCTGIGWTMFASDPPTEAELDTYVRTGNVPY